MDLQLEGQHVLITGGSKGIGLACALGFLNEGARVSLVSRNLTTLQSSAQALPDAVPNASMRVGIFAADLTDAAAAVAAIDAAAHPPMNWTPWPGMMR